MPALLLRMVKLYHILPALIFRRWASLEEGQGPLGEQRGNLGPPPFAHGVHRHRLGSSSVAEGSSAA